MTKIQPHVMLVFLNVTMELSSVRKNKGTTECDKSTITYDVSIAQCEEGTIKCEKKIKRTTNCDKSTITCDISFA